MLVSKAQHSNPLYFLLWRCSRKTSATWIFYHWAWPPHSHHFVRVIWCAVKLQNVLFGPKMAGDIWHRSKQNKLYLNELFFQLLLKPFFYFSFCLIFFLVFWYYLFYILLIHKNYHIQKILTILIIWRCPSTGRSWLNSHVDKKARLISLSHAGDTQKILTPG